MNALKTRKNKLVFLKNFLNLETGEVDESVFIYENALYKKAIQKKSLDARIRRCRLCPGLNIKRLTECCPGWGDLNARIFFIGQSAHKPAVVSDLPFILASGYCIDTALRLSGLLRKDAFFSNVVHGHPGGNRGSLDEEKKNCLHFLQDEINLVKPKMIVALGNDAKAALEILCPGYSMTTDPKVLKITHPASFMYGAPEMRVDWVVKLSLEIDKIYKNG